MREATKAVQADTTHEVDECRVLRVAHVLPGDTGVLILQDTERRCPQVR